MSTPSTHPDARRLAAYRAGHLPAAEALGVSDHLADCPACRSALPASRSAATLEAKMDLPTVLPDAPPTYEEMAALLDGTLDASQSAAMRARIAASPEGTAAFAGLQSFRNEIAALPPKWHGPAQPSVAAGLPATKPLPNPGGLVPFPSLRRAPLLAAAAIVLFVAAWWLATGTRPTKAPPLWAEADLSLLPGDLRQGVERAAQSGTVDVPPLLAELSPPPGTLAGSSPLPTTLRQIAPVAVVVREDRPALRWTAVEDASSYVVYLMDSEENTPLLRQEVPGGTTLWTPPVPLARGVTFKWQVEARRGEEVLSRAPRPPAPETLFRVLDQQHDSELAGVERLYPRNPLILGTAYAQAGLVRAAGRQFEELARRYPKSGAAERLHQETVSGTTAEK